LVKQIHHAFLVPGHGVFWKMKEDLSGPYPGYGFGALDAFDGYISYRMLDESILAGEIADMADLMKRSAPDLVITQDLGLGMMLWLSHFYSEEDWAVSQRQAQPSCS
jgi:ABC-type thiamine transport system substrate-binding protein